MSDTITAIATPRGNSALAIIRISGGNTFEIIRKISSSRYLDKIRANDYSPLHTRVFRVTIHDKGRKLDDGMLCLFMAPKSYTGEDMAELYLHGNDFIVSQVLETILRCGDEGIATTYCRLAEPGEFTQRAFLNKKIDLTQAEAVGNLLSAKTIKAQQAALYQMEGRLYKHIRDILDKITQLRITFELAIDFVEDEVPDYDTTKNIEKIDDILDDLKNLIDTAHNGIITQNGLKVVLAGAPNVGKSSIFNSFLQTERAIITPIAGTTRDYLEEAFSLDGYLIRLFDTAGLHDTTDPVEKIGIKRTQTLIASADLIFYITSPEIDQQTNEDLLSSLPPEKTIKVINKIDLLTEAEIKIWENSGYILTSTVGANNHSPLQTQILTRFKNIDTDLESGIITNARQLACVKKSYQNLSKARESIINDLGIDFVAFDISEASGALEEIIGRVSSEDILSQIFKEFCIGK